MIPGSTPRGRRDVTVSDPGRAGRRTKRRGATVSHDARRTRTSARHDRGRPRRSRENPARTTSTTTGLRPGFVTRTSARADPANATCAGAAVSASGGPRRARARRSGHEHGGGQEQGRERGSSADHRERDGRGVPTGGTTGSGDTKPSRVSQTSPASRAPRGRVADEEVRRRRDRDRGHRTTRKRRPDLAPARGRPCDPSGRSAGDERGAMNGERRTRSRCC